MQDRTRALTIGLAKSMKQVDGAVGEVLELSEDLRVDYDPTSLDSLVLETTDPSTGGTDITGVDRLVRIETGKDLAVFKEEVVSLSRDLVMRSIAGEDVLQPLNPGGEVLDVFIQSVGLETVEDLVTESVEVDDLPLNAGKEVPIGFHELLGNVDVGTDVRRVAPLQSSIFNGQDPVLAILGRADIRVCFCS